ncbi:MAG: ribosome-binding factor A [Candidatus Moraniibacteriota bacterium]|nr:MAG: ribosome-binding factor A [Candidatus Moranbacteria bacterium]
MTSLRIQKVNEHIREELGNILSSQTHLKSGVLVTITKVSTTPDLKTARIGISTFPEEETHYALTALKREMYTLQGELNRRLRMRPIPRILFLEDTTSIAAQDVESALLTIKKETSVDEI